MSQHGARHGDKARATLGPASLHRVMLEWTQRGRGRAGGKLVKKNSPGSFLTEQSLQQAGDNDARQKQNDLDGAEGVASNRLSGRQGASPWKDKNRVLGGVRGWDRNAERDGSLSRADLGEGWSGEKGRTSGLKTEPPSPQVCVCVCVSGDDAPLPHASDELSCHLPSAWASPGSRPDGLASG